MLLLVLGACARSPSATSSPPPDVAERQRPADGGICVSPDACVSLAHALLKSPSAGPRDSRVTQAFQRACDLGSGYGCLRLAQVAGAARDDRAVVNRLLDRACDLGEMRACSLIGEAYLEGERGRVKDAAKGLELLNRACDGGDSATCKQLSDMYRVGGAVTRRDAKTAAAYRKRAEAMGWVDP